MSELKARIVSALVLAAVVLTATLAGGWLFAAVATMIAVIVWAEWLDMACPGCDDRIRLLGVVLLGLLFVGALFLPNSRMALAWAVATAAFVLAAMGFSGEKWSVAGFLYSGLTLVALIMLRESGDAASGLIAILFLYAVVWATDIGAYFAGRAIGGPKILPVVSPKKTWSGGIGGVISAIFAGIVVLAVAGVGSPGLAVILAVVLSVVSQIGDFFESWIKRRAGVKDSSRIIPGHGGFMDRVDGLVFAAIVLWAMSLAGGGFERPSSAFFGG